jgi:RNA recognition motif-containing protein
LSDLAFSESHFKAASSDHGEELRVEATIVRGMEVLRRVEVGMEGRGDSAEGDGPDPDAIKMFVGQVPRSMDEVGVGGSFSLTSCSLQETLKDFFKDFGSVYQLNILRDKTTGVSRCGEGEGGRRREKAKEKEKEQEKEK